jgi:hypothetical protein
MQAIREGEIRGYLRFHNNDGHWLDNVDVPLRLLSEGLERDDFRDVKRMLLQAESAGVIQSADAIGVALELHRDLKINSRELRDAGEWMLHAIAHGLLN